MEDQKGGKGRKKWEKHETAFLFFRWKGELGSLCSDRDPNSSADQESLAMWDGNDCRAVGGGVGVPNHSSFFWVPFSLAELFCTVMHCMDQQDRSSAGTNSPLSADQFAWMYCQRSVCQDPSELNDFISPLAPLPVAAAGEITVFWHVGWWQRAGRSQRTQSVAWLMEESCCCSRKRIALLSDMMMSFIQNTESTECNVRQHERCEGCVRIYPCTVT